ncbi:hypothetical protein [Acinetobacter sp. CFCC 10889]|uniref:hypothetical protein n=1 Tax=Acinetobacter sp. CFCC 10889 TaxID=1775557 RepID=UPI000DD0150D|nr:hypothetical protein [Acinetobacter sp. CFCC 10889]
MADKTIEEMVHDYVVAQLSSGIGVTRCDIKEFTDIACEVKGQSAQRQKEINQDAQRRRW